MGGQPASHSIAQLDYKKKKLDFGKLGCHYKQQGDHGKIKVTVPSTECHMKEEGSRRRGVETRGKPIFGEGDCPNSTKI